MKALSLLHVDVAAGQQQATTGRSLSSNYVPPSLENKLLAQASLLMPRLGSHLSSLELQPSSCPSLQPSSLSSTTSTFPFSTSSSSCSPSLTSPLLSTENRLLSRHAPVLFPSSSSSSSAAPAFAPHSSFLSTTLANSALLCHSSHLPSSSLFPGLRDEQKKDDGRDEGEEETSEAMQSCGEETSVHSEEDGMVAEQAQEEADLTIKLPVLETELSDQERDQTVPVRQDEFAEVEPGKDDIEEELKDKKYLLLNAVCCSLVNKSTAPGQKDWDSEDSVWTRITSLAEDICASDPQFLLKVAVYTRQELNIRITANFLLALAAHQSPTKPHVRRYFCAAVQLPSDWLEVARIYSTCFSRCLPACLKKAMADKFKQFSEYQLAKYNTRKHRCKHNRNRPKGKKPTDKQLKEWADMVRSDATILKKFLRVEGSPAVVDKKQSEFSMKKMIKKLHIKEPAEHVMAILGRKYPADVKAFTHSGLSGVWDRERAGRRMKLKQPETWEHLLSQQGNKAATWEKLIDDRSLPFMAMLRNLRNMITQGISENHHKKILSRLMSKKAVIQSRQFPFRFLAAYKVMMELHRIAMSSQKALPPSKEILKGILKKIPQSRRYKRLDWETAQRKRMRVALGVPFVYRMYTLKRAQLQKANQRQFTVALLDRYRKALEAAVQISCRYNVPPLPGRTVVFLSTNLRADNAWGQKHDFCCPPDPEDEKKEGEEEEEEEEEGGEEGKRKTKKKGDKDDSLTPSMTEVAVLLSLMIGYSAEDFKLCLADWNHSEEAKLKSDVLLENVRSIIKQIQERQSSYGSGEQRSSFISQVLTKKNKVDNIIVLTDNWIHPEIQWAINNYRKNVNDKALLVEIFLSERPAESAKDRNHVTLSGFSEQMLRFVAERGSSRLLDHVEHLDKLHNIPPPQGANKPQTTTTITPIPASPSLRWRGVRVFISSTFRDMHAERDVLVRAVFPELRRRAAPHCLYLQEVELRWGVTEEESGRATELCLSEVCRSHMLVGILGERYGLVPPRPALPDLPQYSWLDSAPDGLSITEMEMRQFQALFPDSAHQRMFCYFRDPNLIKSVPVAWRSDFAPESKEAEAKMADLKKRIRVSDVKVTENYPCEWGGVMEGKPYLKGLEDFAKTVLEDLWTAVKKIFVEDGDDAEAASDVSEQEVHQGAQQRQFYGRAKLLAAAVEKVQDVQGKGGLMLVEGAPGEGKTVFMAALANALRMGDKSKRKLGCDVISYSTAASQSARSVENLLRCLVHWLRRRKDTEEEPPLPLSYKDLLAEFHTKLSDIKKDQPLVLLVDGAELVRDGRGQLNSDWIPQQLPQGVCLAVSVKSSSALLQTLSKKRGAVLFALGQLSVPDRKEIVQKQLDAFGKKLSDSAFNNQLQTLMMKKGAVSPLYLHLACDDLRKFASFDKLKESIQSLPQSLTQLVQYSLDRLCSQYRGVVGLRSALAALTVSAAGLRERDLYGMLNICNELFSRSEQVTWEEVLHLSRKPRGRVPMATFTHIVQSLQSLVGPSHSHGPDDLLALTHPEVRRAFEEFLLPAERDRTRAHLVLSAHLWALADPQGADTFLHCEASSIMHLPSHLMGSDQLEALYSLLSSYYFLYANVRHGLLHHILEIYSLYDKKRESTPSAPSQKDLQECWGFLRRHAILLSSWPALFIQQALSEAPHTSAHTWAQGLKGHGGARVVQWLNNDTQNLLRGSELVSTFSSEPTCVAASPDGGLMVVGTGQGTLHFIHTKTGQEVRSLVSNCDGISNCLFLSDVLLATTSFDGRIETWDIENGCRTALIDGHSNMITGSDVSADRKHLATVSLDFMLKVWSSAKNHEVATMPSSSPMNCVTFDPEGHLLAAGCWNGDVMVWNWLQNKMLTTLTGHEGSVRSLSFSPSSSMLCSGSLSGEVRVWSVPTSTCVGRFQAHTGATEVLTFLEEGSILLSAGADHMIHFWSGGLGCSVNVLGEDKYDQEPPQKKLKSTASEPAALCVAGNGEYYAVGYHGDGIKLLNFESGETTWATEDLRVSVLCLMWLTVEQEQAGPELLVSGGGDKNLRVWRRTGGQSMLGGLALMGQFGVQQGPILALAQNSSYLASASDDFTIALWSVEELTPDPWVDPTVVSMLRGHSGGVTCLAFSPDGGQLLSGGKDQALMVWDVSSSPPALSKSLPHSHRDWITGCVWTPDCVVSSSNDGRLCVWDLQTGRSLSEIPWRSPLSSICCLGRYVVAGCAEGVLHVWKWETGVEISHISAHQQRINHCSVLPDADKNKEVVAEDMIVATTSDDGTVKLWRPFQVEHFSTFQGHSGGINGVVLKEGIPEFLSISEDCSLRCYLWAIDNPPDTRGPVTALCFSQSDDLLLAGYESGLLEIWLHNRMVSLKQGSDSAVTAICSMPDGQFAVSYRKPCIHVWKLQWNHQHSVASLVKVSTYTAQAPVMHLCYCSVLIGASDSGTIYDVTVNNENDWRHIISNWTHSVRILGMIRNDEKSMWLVGETEGTIHLGFTFSMGSKTGLHSGFSSVLLERDQPEGKGSLITAVTVDKEFVVCGDVKGNMWFNQPPELSSWSNRKPAHSGRISALRVTSSTIVSASYDRTVKLWDRSTKKQVGMFVCEGPVLLLEVNQQHPTQLVCGDGLGKLYFLSWKE
ncbi:telomerase protein component 1 [Myripristis murdjan]|uniref:telomerase protein component 1 n=1 Tax=Myripristis murdjan TaxID=586833 RepID=UPI0011761D69|nr:telomerase protein component 1 [Myripristis murdjan]